MPTLDEWEQALATPRRVRIESSPALVQEVSLRHSKKDAERQQANKAIAHRKPALSVVPAFAPFQDLLIPPLTLLHRLGVVTTPPIENLADICSTWAYLRYLWAFEIPPPGALDFPLLLSEAARNIDFHQKSLLSDQIGVGMAAYLLGAHLDAPLAVDVSVAMDDPNWHIDLQYETSPDYLFFDATQSNLFVVECKGTQTSRHSSLEQLRRGTEQVPSLSFTDGHIPQSIVVATCLAKKGTQVLVIDPPNDEKDKKRPSGSERVGEREWTVRDEEVFSRTTRLLSAAKLLSFGGADKDAAEKLEGIERMVSRTPRSAPREIEYSENAFGEFRGVRQRVGLKDRFTLDIFQGLDIAVFKALVSDEPARTKYEIKQFQTRSARAPGPDIHGSQSILTTRERGAVVVRSAGPDGSLLEVKVSPN